LLLERPESHPRPGQLSVRKLSREELRRVRHPATLAILASHMLCHAAAEAARASSRRRSPRQLPLARTMQPGGFQLVQIGEDGLGLSRSDSQDGRHRVSLVSRALFPEPKAEDLALALKERPGKPRPAFHRQIQLGDESRPQVAWGRDRRSYPLHQPPATERGRPDLRARWATGLFFEQGAHPAAGRQLPQEEIQFTPLDFPDAAPAWVVLQPTKEAIAVIRPLDQESHQDELLGPRRLGHLVRF